MTTKKLNLTREQLSTFLKNHEQIKQFEKMFAVVDVVQEDPDTVTIRTTAETALALANSSLGQILDLAREVGLNSEAQNKAIQALDSIARLAEVQASILDQQNLLAQAPVPQEHKDEGLDNSPPPTRQHNSISTDYIDLPEVGPHVSAPRRIQWNADDGTIDVGLYNGVMLQVGQEHHYYAKNASGSLIANGTACMLTGVVGVSGKIEFGLAVTDGSVPGDYLMGVATQDVADNAFGYVTSFGLVRGWDTTGTPYGEVWADGDLLYIDPASPGDWTNVPPAAPNLHNPLAVVINASAGGSGSVFARFRAGDSISTLHDVQVTSAAINHILQWSAANSRWENTGTPSFGTATDYTNFEADGTAQAHGAATCFRDELNDLLKTGRNNPSANLQDDLTEGALVFKTTAGTGDWALMNVQLNHDWVTGTDVEPHIHWWQDENNTPNWLLQYRFQINGGAKTTAWTSLPWVSNKFTYVSGTLNQITSFGNISTPASPGVSLQLQLRYLRDNSNASGLFSGADPFSTDASATAADTHLQVDMLGSRQQYVK